MFIPTSLRGFQIDQQRCHEQIIPPVSQKRLLSGKRTGNVVRIKK